MQFSGLTGPSTQLASNGMGRGLLVFCSAVGLIILLYTLCMYVIWTGPSCSRSINRSLRHAVESSEREDISFANLI